MRIADVLRGKGTDVATIGPSAPVVELLAQLTAYNVGALPVVDDGRLVGIVAVTTDLQGFCGTGNVRA